MLGRKPLIPSLVPYSGTFIKVSVAACYCSILGGTKSGGCAGKERPRLPNPQSTLTVCIYHIGTGGANRGDSYQNAIRWGPTYSQPAPQGWLALARLHGTLHSRRPGEACIAVSCMGVMDGIGTGWGSGSQAKPVRKPRQSMINAGLWMHSMLWECQT